MNGDVYLVAADLAGSRPASCGWASRNEIARFKGAQVEGAVFRHPFLERDSVGVLADYVTLDQGTGAVHTAPGHGQDDYVTGQRYGIATYCPVDAAGRFFHAEGAPGRLPEELIGKTVWEANPVVIEILQVQRARCSAWKRSTTATRIAGAATNRPSSAPPSSGSSAWIATNCARTALEAIRNVKWMPEWGEERISNMIANRPDWCISRQRVWGMPIIVFYCDGLQRARSRIARFSIAWWTCSPANRRRRLVRANGRGVDRARWRPVPKLRLDDTFARRTTFWTCGSSPAPATWPC